MGSCWERGHQALAKSPCDVPCPVSHHEQQNLPWFLIKQQIIDLFFNVVAFNALVEAPVRIVAMGLGNSHLLFPQQLLLAWTGQENHSVWCRFPVFLLEFIIMGLL